MSNRLSARCHFHRTNKCLGEGADEDGQGSVTLLAQITAEELKVPLDKVKVRRGDTDEVTYLSRGSTSQRTAFNVGNAVRLACKDAKRQLFSIAADAPNLSCAAVSEGRILIPSLHCVAGICGIKIKKNPVKNKILTPFILWNGFDGLKLLLQGECECHPNQDSSDGKEPDTGRDTDFLAAVKSAHFRSDSSRP